MKRSFTQNFGKIIWLTFGAFLVLWACMYSYVHAATQPDAFIVEVNPSSFEVNDAVDLTIRAVNANGEVIQDYVWDVFIEIDGIADTADYVVPSEWFYMFLPQDQWITLFSKGLIIRRSWTFAVKVSDIMNESIAGEKTIIVGSTHTSAEIENVSIVSPAADGIERNNVVNVIANATTLPNSPYSIFLNNSIVSEWTTDSIGDINTYISGVVVGSNLLQIKISNASNEIIWQSSSIGFSYSPVKDGILDSIQILPSSKIKQGTKATFNLSTSDSVTSAKIILSNGTSLPMDNSSAWLFTKEILMTTDGTFDVWAQLIFAGQTKTYTGVTRIIVDKSTSIGKIRLYSDSVDKTKLNVTWETIWSAPKYKVQYGTSDVALDQFVVVPSNEIIVENLILGATYYFQITPLDNNENVNGIPSTVANSTIGADLACVVEGITITGQKIWGKYYLIWTAVQNVNTYLIYRSDFETDDSSKMKKVGETTGTMFEYPFNNAAKKDEFAFYLVEASCKDGTNVKIDSAKRIQVWPVENILLFVVISLFGYCMYKLYDYSNQ